MSVSSKLLRGTVFVATATILARAGTFLGNVAAIRLLGKDAVGQWGLIESWLTITAMFSLLGVGVAASKYVAQYLEVDAGRTGGIAGAAIVLSTVTGLIVAATSYVILTLHLFWIWSSVQRVLADHALVFFWLILATTFREIAANLVYGFQSFRSLVRVNALVGLASFPSLYLFARWHALEGVLEARLTLTVLETALLTLAVRKIMQAMGVVVSFRGLARNVRQLAGFGIPTFFGHLAANPLQTFLMSLLAAQRAGYSALGALTTANRLSSLATFLPGQMAPTVIPILSSEWGKGTEGRFTEGSTVAMRMFWLVSLPIAVFFMAASPALLVWLYGKQYLGAWPVAFVLLIIGLLSAANETCDRALAAAGRQWLSSANNYLWTGGFLLLGIWLIPRYLAVGYVTAFVLSFLLYVLLQLWWMRRLFHLDLTFLAPLVTLSGTAIAVSWLLATQTSSLAQVALAAAVAALTVAVEYRFILDRAQRDALRRRGKEYYARGLALSHLSASRSG